MMETIKTKSSANDDKSQLVQMRLQPKTMQLLESISGMTNTTNRTLIISSSIQLAEAILKNVNAGGKVYIETKTGEKELLQIIGL